MPDYDYEGKDWWRKPQPAPAPKDPQLDWWRKDVPLTPPLGDDGPPDAHELERER